MLRRLLLGHQRSCPARIRLSGGVVMLALVTLSSARAQQPAEQEQQAPAQQQTPSAPPVQQKQPAPQVSTSKGHLPAIVVTAAKPKAAKPSRTGAAQPHGPQPQNATAAAQAALDAKMSNFDQARDDSS